MQLARAERERRGAAAAAARRAEQQRAAAARARKRAARARLATRAAVAARARVPPRRSGAAFATLLLLILLTVWLFSRSVTAVVGHRARIGDLRSPSCTSSSSNRESDDARVCCRPSTSPTAPRCGWCRARRAPRRRTATRWRPRWRGSATGRSGSTSSTSTPPSGGAATASCSPRWSGVSTSRSSCPAASATTRRWRRRSPPGRPGSTSAPPRSSPRTGCATAIARHGDQIAVGLDVRGTTLAARGWTQDGGDLWETLARLDADGCARYVVTDVRRDGTLTGPNLQLLSDVCARTDRPVVASGGVSSLDDLRAIAGLTAVRRRGCDRRQGPVRRGVHAARGPRRRALRGWITRCVAHLRSDVRPRVLARRETGAAAAAAGRRGAVDSVGRRAADVREASTPRTFERYTLNTDGAA